MKKILLAIVIFLFFSTTEAHAVACSFSGCSSTYLGYWYAYNPNCSVSCSLGCDNQWPVWPTQYSCTWSCGTCTLGTPYGTCTASCGGGTQSQDGYNPCGAQCYSGTAACNQQSCAASLTAASSISTTGFTANWGAASGATTYYVDVSTVFNFASYVHQNLSTASTSYAVTGLSAGTLYYYRVLAQNAYGNSGESSTGTVYTLPTAASCSAASSVSTSGFTANWSAVTGAATYYLDVSTASNFSSFVYQNLSTASTSYAVTGLSSGTTYYYRVRAANSSGSGANCTAVSMITLPTAASCSAASSVSTSGFTANWSAVTGAATYYLDVSTASNFSSFVYQNLSTASTSYAVTGLSSGTTYYYRVRAANASGSGANCTAVSTTTLSDIPTCNAPSSMTGTSFTASWSTVTGATSYRLDVATDTGFTSYVTGYQDLTVAGTSQSVSGLTQGVIYYYRARSVGAGGTSGNCAYQSTITIANAPTLGNPTNITSTGFTANWNSVSGASSYALDVATGTSGQSTFSSFATGYNNLDVGNVTTKSVTGLSTNSTYFYRVRAVNNSGTSSQPSNYKAVTTAPSGNACPISIGSNITITSSCTFPGSTNGSDAGLTIQAGATLTVNAGQTIVWAPGSSITIPAGASIALNSSAQIKKSYLWMPVATSGDAYPKAALQYAQSSQPTNGTDGFTTFKRRNGLTDIYTLQ